MNRLLVVLITALIISTATAIFALRGPNDYGDRKNRDAMYEHRMTDWDEDDPFDYEWVSQGGEDSDGPLYSNSYNYASQYYEDVYQTSASTNFGCNEDGFLGEFNASASVLGFESQLGLTLDKFYPSTPYARGSYNESFSRAVWSYADFTPETDPLQIRNYGTSSCEIEVFGDVHKSESAVPVSDPAITTW